MSKEMGISQTAFNQLLWESKEEGFTALEYEIIYRDLCSACGLCAAVCPVDVIEIEEEPKLIGKCINCGYCLMQCPRSFLRRKEIEKSLFGNSSGEGEAFEVLGVYRKIISAKAKSEKALKNAQDGGVVTAILEYLLKEKKIQGAIVSSLKEGEAWKPEPRLINTLEELYKSAGSRYSTSPNLAKLNEVKKMPLEKIAVVGTACHCDGVGKLKVFEIEEINIARKIDLIIGIFCKSNFYYSLIKEIIAEKITLSEIEKFDIKGKYFIVIGKKGSEIKIPLKEINKKYKRSGCRVCTDFTGRLSDISVGSIGSEEGYSTVIIRSEKGEKIIEEMIRKNLLDVKEISDENIEKIRKLANTKFEQAKKVIEKKRNEELPLPLKYIAE